MQHKKKGDFRVCERNSREMKEERDLQHALISEMLAVCRRHHCAMEGLASGIGGHHAQQRLLMFLSDRDGVPVQKEIARFLRISPSAVAVMLKKLEKNGYIEKFTESNDGRVNRVEITPSGEEAVRKMRDIFSGAEKVICDGLTAEDMGHMLSCFDKMLENMNRLEPQHMQKKRKDETLREQQQD